MNLLRWCWECAADNFYMGLSTANIGVFFPNINFRTNVPIYTIVCFYIELLSKVFSECSLEEPWRFTHVIGFRQWWAPCRTVQRKETSCKIITQGISCAEECTEVAFYIRMCTTKAKYWETKRTNSVCYQRPLGLAQREFWRLFGRRCQLCEICVPSNIPGWAWKSLWINWTSCHVS